jgi:Domain of unknown function (DUF5671)
MVLDPKIHDFIERMKASGASDQSIAGILAARGWPEKDIYEALAVHYERRTGIEIPRRAGAATAAKDAFFYPLAFSTLATWTLGVGSLAFTLIDEWLADTLFSDSYNPAYQAYNIAASMASVIVAFPIYLLGTRAIIRDGKANPEKLNSPVRKWLTYMALVIAAGVFIGDLIAALTYLLRGEITSRSCQGFSGVRALGRRVLLLLLRAKEAGRTRGLGQAQQGSIDGNRKCSGGHRDGDFWFRAHGCPKHAAPFACRPTPSRGLISAEQPHEFSLESPS